MFIDQDLFFVLRCDAPRGCFGLFSTNILRRCRMMTRKETVECLTSKNANKSEMMLRCDAPKAAIDLFFYKYFAAMPQHDAAMNL
jgi:hypothetical protein